MRLKKENTIAVCVDYQEKLMPAISQKDIVLNRAEILVKGLKALGIPVVVTQQYTKGLGETVETIRNAIGEYELFEKMTFGACEEPAFKELMDRHQKPDVLVFGVETHICVLQTALGLHEAGYRVMIVDDCCGSRREADKESGLRRAMCEGICVSCSETVLFELTAVAGTETFKIISKLVK